MCIHTCMSKRSPVDRQYVTLNSSGFWFIYFVKIRQFTYKQTNLMAMVINVSNQRKLETKRNWNTADFFPNDMSFKMSNRFSWYTAVHFNGGKGVFFSMGKRFAYLQMFRMRFVASKCMAFIQRCDILVSFIALSIPSYIEIGNTKYIGNGWNRFMQ